MNNLIPVSDLKEMANSLGKLFQKSPQDLFALMLIAQAEGLHPAVAAQEYDIINGRPAINSKSALARFQRAGGKIQWNTRTDKQASATFTHENGGTCEITWTIERAAQAGLAGKSTWKAYPAQMLASRVVAEGVRAVFPACLSGMYTNEEVQDMPPLRNVTHEKEIPYGKIEELEPQKPDDYPTSSHAGPEVSKEPELPDFSAPSEEVEEKKTCRQIMEEIGKYTEGLDLDYIDKVREKVRENVKSPEALSEILGQVKRFKQVEDLNKKNALDATVAQLITVLDAELVENKR